MDRITELLAALATASDADIQAGRDAITARARELQAAGQPPHEIADEVGQLADADERLATEQQRRTQAATTVSDALSRLTATPEGTDGTDGTPPAGEPSTDGGATGAPPEPNTTGEGQPPAPTGGTGQSGQSGQSGQLAARGRLNNVRPPTAPVRMEVHSQASLSSMVTGQTLTLDQAVEALADAAGRQTHGEFRVLKFRADAPANRRLNRGDEVGNTTKIREVTGLQAITAAGFCAPFTIDYGVDVLGVTQRPVRDALAQFQADRGGVQVRPNIDLAAANAGISRWTAANDAAVGTGGQVTKPCWDVPCGVPVSASLDAVTLCLRFSNMTARFDPEGTRAAMEAGLIAHARYAENLLYEKLVAGSLDITTTRVLGAVRDVLVTLDKIAAYFRNRRRLADTTPLRWILPAWLRDMMRADLVRDGSIGSLDAMAVSDQIIASWFAARNINPSWHLDGLAAVVGPPAVAQQFYNALADGDPAPPFPDTVSTVLFPEGEWLFLDGGELDLGVLRDAESVAVNRYQQFSETFEGVAHKGPESLHVILSLQPTGQAAGTKDTNAVAD